MEHSWGMSHMKFRQEIKEQIPDHLDRNAVASICPTNTVNVETGAALCEADS